MAAKELLLVETLALKGIEYEYKAVHLLKDGGEQFLKDYQSKNPQCEVPALEIDGVVLTQSIAIMEYLDETRGPPFLLPKDDLKKRAQVRSLSNIIACGIQPIQNLKVLQYVGAEKKAEWGKHWIEQGFNGLELALGKTSGKYCLGDEITMADLCLVPQVFNAQRFKVDLSQYPLISKINDNLSALDCFKVAHPSRQPDCPEELK